jgi:hypothetical protein
MNRDSINIIGDGCFCPHPRTPFGCKSAKNENIGGFWSGVVRVESDTPDQNTLDFIGLVRVVRVVRGLFTLSHTRARMYVFIFLSTFILIFQFDFIENTSDHPDHINDYAGLYPDHHP